MRRYFQICAALAAFILCAMIFHAWLASHDEQLRLQGVIKTQGQAIDAANARERDRAVALNQTMAQIDKLKRATQTPQQVLQELPKYLPLPEPITMASAGGDRDVLASGETSAHVELGSWSRSSSRTEAAGAEAGANEKGSRAGVAWEAPRVVNSLAAEAGVVRREIEHRLSPGTGCANGGQDAAQRDSASGRSREADPHIDGSERQSSGPSTQDASRSTPENASSNASGQEIGGSRSGSNLPDAPRAATRPATASIQPSSSQPACPGASQLNLSDANSPSAVIPAADLKPLYDYVQDCRACQAQLAGAKQEHLDDATKLAALTRERDAAITASKGGSFWRRLNRNATWFAIGAAAATAAARGAALAATYRHATR
jgi:hypothetical protein